MNQDEAIHIPNPNKATRLIHLIPRLLGIVRSVWIGLFFFLLIIFSIGTILHYSDLRQPCTLSQEVCLQTLRLQPVNLQGLDSPENALQFYAAFFTAEQVFIRLILWIIAALIFWKRRDHWPALLVAFWLLTYAPPFAEFAAAQRWPWLFVPLNAEMLIGQISAMLFFFIFPSGRFTPAWMRWPAGFFLVFTVATVLFPRFSTALNQTIWSGFVLAVQFGFIIYSQIYRYRHDSSLVERDQIKWIIFGVILSSVFLVANRFWIGVDWSLDAPLSSKQYLQMMAFSIHTITIPVTLGVAILRYRLFDIDLVLNRTMVFGTLAALVAGTYALVVSGMNFIIGSYGLNFLSSLIAASIIALFFLPIYHRLQHGVNRLIYGDRDEPYQVLARLGQKLESAIDPGSALSLTVETVAQALKLPYAAISYHQSGELLPAVAYGVPRTPVTRFQLNYAGEIIGEFLAGQRDPNDSFSPADIRLLSDLARQISVAAHAAQLSQDLLKARLRIVEAREETRRRLGSDLHDGVGHQLTALVRQSEQAMQQVTKNPQAAVQALKEVNDQLNTAITQVRALAHQLHPPELEVLGLIGALREQAQAHPTISIRFDLPAHLPELPASIETAAYYIALEALTNIEKHASARSCLIRLSFTAIDVAQQPILHLEISDDGVGLVSSVSEGLGLLSMQGRALEAGGTCQFVNNPEGGITVKVSLPYQRLPGGI